MPNQNHALSCGLCRSTEALLFTANVTCNTCGTVYCSNCFQNYGIASTKCHTCLGNDFQLTMPLVPPSTLPVHHILPPLLPLSDYRMTEVNAADIWEVYMDEDVEVDDTVPPPRQPQPMQPPAPPPTALETLTLCVPVSLPIEHTMHIPCTELLCEFKSNNARQLSLHKALVHRIDLSWLYTEEGEAAAKAAKVSMLCVIVWALLNMHLPNPATNRSCRRRRQQPELENASRDPLRSLPRRIQQKQSQLVMTWTTPASASHTTRRCSSPSLFLIPS